MMAKQLAKTAQLKIRQNIFLSIALLLAITLTASANAKTYIGIVQGLPGEDFYQVRFDEQSAAIREASGRLSGDKEIEIFSGDAATKLSLLTWLENISDRSTVGDRVLIYYIGHGSFDDTSYKFNLTGPDLTGEELKAEFEAIPAERKALINTGSSSGALLELFAEDTNVALVTATKSGRERNATRFGRFLAEALVDESADLDKNQVINLKEAFDFAERATADFYSSEGLIATEHPVLQADQASLIALASLSDLSMTTQSPELVALYEERDQVDLDIERLRLRRIGINEADYRGEFQKLMINLSLLQAEIDTLEGRTE